MVGELRVHFGDVRFRHVATGAVRRRDGTNSGSLVVARRFTSPRNMARQAALIIKARDANQPLVRVVTGDTGQASISVSSPATAFLQAIWLEADVDRPVGFGGFDHVHRCPMAGAAEVHRFHGAQIRGVKNGLYRFAALIGVNRLDVLQARSMTLLTMDSGHSTRSVELGIRG